MVFASLIEYTVVSYMSNHKNLKLSQVAKKYTPEAINGKVAVLPHHMPPIIHRKGSLDQKEDSEMMDPIYLTVRKFLSMQNTGCYKEMLVNGCSVTF